MRVSFLEDWIDDHTRKGKSGARPSCGRIRLRAAIVFFERDDDHALKLSAAVGLAGGLLWVADVLVAR